MASFSSSSNIVTIKSRLRTELKKRLEMMTVNERVSQSNLITESVINSEAFRNSRRISIYLSMPEEVNTIEILRNIFAAPDKKKCFVPRYTKNNMEMLELFSMEDYNNLPSTKWNIRQPPPNDEFSSRVEALESGGLDLIILPGLGFSYDTTSKKWARLGRGKGYYDKYVEKCLKYSEENHCSPPRLVGLGFKEQICENDEIPSSQFDQQLDQVIY